MKEHDLTPGNIPEGYRKCVTKMLYGGIAWIRKHGLEGLEFRVPPSNCGFASDLPPAIPRLASTQESKRFLRALEDAAPGEATAFQAICVIGILDLPTKEWTEQDYAGLQQITKGGSV